MTDTLRILETARSDKQTEISEYVEKYGGEFGRWKIELDCLKDELAQIDGAISAMADSRPLLDQNTIKIMELIELIEDDMTELHQCAICDKALNAFVAGRAATAELRETLKGES